MAGENVETSGHRTVSDVVDELHRTENELFGFTTQIPTNSGSLASKSQLPLETFTPIFHLYAFDGQRIHQGALTDSNSSIYHIHSISLPL